MGAKMTPTLRLRVALIALNLALLVVIYVAVDYAMNWPGVIR